jgi:hypothetical protein
MADLQSGAERRKHRGKRGIRERCTHRCTQRARRPCSVAGGRGMVEPARRGPGRHPRDGRGEQAVGGASACLRNFPSPPQTACGAACPSVRKSRIGGRGGGVELLAIQRKPRTGQPACMPPKCRAFFQRSTPAAAAPGRVVGIVGGRRDTNPMVPLIARVAEIATLGGPPDGQGPEADACHPTEYPEVSRRGVGSASNLLDAP